MIDTERLLTPFETAWMAGLFEGEGCIFIRRTARPYVQLKLEMCDEDVVSRFHKFANCGNVTIYRPRDSNHNTTYTWRVGDKANVCRLLQSMSPWFGGRRLTKAIEVLSSFGVTGAP